MKQNFGKFHVQRKLGEGATSTVYLGKDEFTGKLVAIKVADKDIFANETVGYKFQSMFINEVSLAGKLRHPHIVSLYDAGIEDEQLYIVMEYVEGNTLKHYISEENPLSFDDINSIFFRCCNALGYAAEKGVIHRDIKPDNILLQEKRYGGFDLKIADFGASLSQHSQRKQIDGVIGTPAYLSPEIICGGKSVDLRTDIYSFGVVMYQLLCGEVPFQADTPQQLFEKIMHEQPVSLAHRKPGIPEVYVKIINRCMQKNPDERYQSWHDIELELTRFYLDEKAGRDAASNQDEPDEIEKFLLLKNLKFFRELTDRKLWETLSIGYWYRLEAGEVVIQDGDEGNTLYVLAAGRLKTLKEGRTLGYIEPGYTIGEVAFVQGEKRLRTATVVCETDVIIVELEPGDLAQVSDSLLSSLQKILLQVLAERLDNISKLAVK